MSRKEVKVVFLDRDSFDPLCLPGKGQREDCIRYLVSVVDLFSLLFLVQWLSN